MNLLIYEHASAGGFREKNFAPSVLSEGFGMLRTATADAKSAGYTVTTILDSQIAKFNPPLDVDQRIAVSSLVEAENSLFEASEDCDATYVIAPSANHKLQELVQRMQNSRSSALSLNSMARGIARASDKMRLKHQADKMGFATPKTITFTNPDNPRKIVETISDNLGFPAVLKPAESDGCEALNIVKNEEHARNAVSKFARPENHVLIAQEFVQGIDASVSLITNGTEAQPIILNKQEISLKTPNQKSTYNGGITPLNHKQADAAFAAAKSLVESIKGLQGYVGVDVVLAENEPVIMEINPRLTTSYVGIRRILNVNMMQATVNSILKHELPGEQIIAGYACFEKVRISNPPVLALRQTFCIPEIISPPFPVCDNKHSYALMCTVGETNKQARQRFNREKKQLRNVLKNRGKSRR